MKKHLLVALLAICFGSSYADVPQVNPDRHSGGIARDSNNRYFAPSADPIPLERKQLTSADRRIAEQAERLIDQNATTAILLIEKGQIVFEKYKSPATQSSPLFSQSMSKSLTAYTVGEMHCSGKIGSLSAPAKTYATTLQGTVMGNSAVTNALTMSSGLPDAVHAGAPYPDQWTDIRTGRTTIAEEIKAYGTRRDIAPGREFRYNSLDTFALSEIADHNGGFFDNFEQTVWQKARTEHAGAWLHDRNLQAMSAAGFSATARDWARLAMYTIQQRQTSGTCMGDFMTAATSPQITNGAKRIGSAFPSYGYQTWIGNFQGKHSYWWVGYGGQRVGIDPKSERIIVITSWREDYMADVYRLWNNWNK